MPFWEPKRQLPADEGPSFAQYGAARLYDSGCCSLFCHEPRTITSRYDQASLMSRPRRLDDDDAPAKNGPGVRRLVRVVVHSDANGARQA